MLPRKASTLRRTTSIPTPRPETSVTSRAVENPGAKMSAKISVSLSRASAATSPFSMARSRTASPSIPAPSSATRIRTWRRSAAPKDGWLPRGGFPAARRTSGDSMPWSMLLRIRCISGSFNWSITVLSSSVSAPSIGEFHFLVQIARQVVDQPRKRSKVARIGSMRMLIEVSRSADVRDFNLL